jgi:glucokinase
VAHAPIGLVGAGTGLGVSGLIPVSSDSAGKVVRWTALRSEGGHVTFSPANETEVAILQFAWRQFEHVSAERLLSGAGLELIYRALADHHGREAEALDAAEISRRGLASECLRFRSLGRNTSALKHRLSVATATDPLFAARAGHFIARSTLTQSTPFRLPGLFKRGRLPEIQPVWQPAAAKWHW